MENRFKLRISRMFRSSFGSCRSKTITDAIEKPVFLPENQQRQLIELFSPKPRPFPSLCRTQHPQTFRTHDHLQTCIPNKILKKPLLLSASTEDSSRTTTQEGQKCPPASPISPLINAFYQFQDHAATPTPTPSKHKEKKSKRASINRRVRSRSKSIFLLDEFSACSYNGLFSSDEDDDDDDDRTTMFSSRSLSSDSSESFRRNKTCKSNRKPRQRRNYHSAGGPNPLAVPELKGKVKDSFAVVKRSSDPYNDFRTSMVEMIVERQMFSGKDLENLLQCLLSLNSYHHHRVIIEVFTDIWEALFANSPS
ncbi:transcription repressor OFP8 [Coffea eugenioides]|uniref:transcription repressor OFP8 n=1 Tax=Coffea eugenioides TaxID=49369 RepID=UPI000F6159D3|nr:transcription repressor OFP8 [Coffea eugenioides]